MSSLRSRRTVVSDEALFETSSSDGRRRRRRRRRNESATSSSRKDMLVKIAFTVLPCLCLGIGYVVYGRQQQQQRHTILPQVSTVLQDSSKQHQQQQQQKTQLRSIMTPEEDVELEFDTDDNSNDYQTRYQIIFSTDCSPYQHWQSYLVYYSAFSVRQRGHVTRIASGCSEDEAIAIRDWFTTHVQPLSPKRFHLHLTPSFSGVHDKVTGKIVGDYKFFNKPFGVLHWLEHSQNFDLRKQQDDVVILIDPDMVLLRPITRNFSNPRSTIVSKKRQKNGMLATTVHHGVPFAQTYGLGTQWETFDLDKITGADDSPAKHVSRQEGQLYYPAGPPILATATDMHKLAQTWSEFVPRVHVQYPHLLAEMFAYCIAAAHLGLKHQLIDSLMVSNTGMNQGEGWALVDKIPAEEMCDFAAHRHDRGYALPSVVHMCQRYCVGEDWFFGKRRVPKDVYDCAKPLFIEPPSNLALLYDYKKAPNQKERKPLRKQIVGRETFMVCFLTSLLNEAAAFYKQRACPAGTANLAKTVKMTDLFSAREKK